ncbi:MAG: sensor histidine kinase [Oscillospiraceae bacterium]|jgi:two-component system sensor histidine kinase YesM|nr:sensor histidine kinase [Oscillospiraceae bacterium]
MQRGLPRPANRRLESLPLRFKLSLLFAGLFLALSVCVTLVLYNTSANDNRAQLRFAAARSFAQAMTVLEGEARAARYAMDIVASNPDAQRLLEQSAQGTPIDLGDEYRLMRKVWDALVTLEARNIYNVRLYVQGSCTYTAQDINFSPFPALAGKDFAALWQGEGRPVWLPPMPLGKDAQPVISLMRTVRAQGDYGLVVGAVRVSLRARVVEDILATSLVTAGGGACLINGAGQIVAASDDEAAARYAGQPLPAAAAQGWVHTILTDGAYLVNAQSVADTDWRMVAWIPTQAFNALDQRVLRGVLTWMVPLMALAFVLIWLLSRSVTGRLSVLSARMADVVERGDLSVRVPVGAQDEIGVLCQTFNYMISAMGAFARQQYEDGKAIKQAELRALQAQINPHFLYNTLDLMNWQALSHDAPELAELAQALARFYRLSLGKGRDFVRLRDEVEHARVYAQIQNSRFDGRIILTTDVPDALGGLEVLKLILQPLVENCVLHGLPAANAARSVHIRIHARREGDSLVITVQDDGVGISPQVARSIAAQHEQNPQQGYGLRNIHMRLRLCYGENYGLAFEDTQGFGTRVCLRMPARRKQSDTLG